MAKPKNEIFVKDITINAGVGPNRAIGNANPDSRTSNIPDKGPNYFEIRLYVEDHGRENDNETGREPEWVDFTQLGGVYRVKNFNDVISVGAEGSKPYVFMASNLTIQLNNEDHAFDDLKTLTIKTINNNDAKFLSTSGGSNLDLNFRPVKIVGRFPEAEMTIERSLCVYTVNSI